MKHYITVMLAIATQITLSGAAPAPGGVEIVSAQGKISSLRTHGYGDVEQAIQMKPRAIFRIASLTKQFTAVAVLALVEDKHLSLDDKLMDRLPDCPLAWRSITLRQLLSQTSGLSGDLGPLLRHSGEDLTPRQLIDLYAKLPLQAPPGERWAYANLNYWILGLVIEGASGLPYADYVDRRVLAPARLTNTRLGSWAAIIAGRIRGYETTTRSIRNARYFSTTIGYSAGGYLSNAEDMARWYGALGRGKIISTAMLNQALTPAKLNDGHEITYGFGWYISKLDGHTVAHHGGSTLGFRSYLYWDPANSQFAAIFLNSSGGDEPKKEAQQLMKQAYAKAAMRASRATSYSRSSSSAH